MTNDYVDAALDPELDRVPRRKFLGAVGATAVAAAISPASLASQSRHAFDNPNLRHEDVKFKSNGFSVPAFVCHPAESGKHPGVIVVHEIFGLTDHIKDIACRLALAGFTGVAVDFFARQGPVPELAGGFDALREYVGRVTDSQLTGDVSGAAKWLHKQRDYSGHVGIVGFCWGGRLAMLAAAESPEIRAAVAYYGRIRADATANQPHSPLDLATKMHAPVLGHFGATDGSIPAADIHALESALKADHKPGEFHIYEGAGHAFNNDTRPSYSADAAKLAWGRTLDWFRKYLK